MTFAVKNSQLCIPVLDQRGCYVCAVCGWGSQAQVKVPFARHCGTERPKQGTLATSIKREEQVDTTGAARRLGIEEKAKRYAKALLRWTLAGFPCRSDEEAQSLYDQFCKPCEHRDPCTDECLKCGCCTSADRIVLRSKTKMATESCPVGKFSATIK